MPAPSDKGIRVSFDIPKTGLPPHEPVNWFNISFSGPELLLSVGMVDLHTLGLASDRKQTEVTLRPEITHRFFMSTRGLLLLKQMVDATYAKMSESGSILAEEISSIEG